MATSLGSYKGTAINPGTDAEVQAQIQAIDASSPISVSSLGTNTMNTDNFPTATTPDYKSAIAGAIASATTPTADPYKEVRDMIAKNSSDQPNYLETYKSLIGDSNYEQTQKDVNDLTAQLNSITASSQASQLGLEGQDVRRTSTVLDKMQNQIARENAIKALPITAALNAAQGRLSSAKENINTLMGLMEKDNATKNEFEQNKISYALQFATLAQKDALEKRQQELDAKKTVDAEFSTLRNAYVNSAMNEGDYATAGKLATATTKEQLQTLATNIVKKPVVTSGTGSNQMTDNERALMSQFRGEQIVKDYNEILGQKGTMDSYIQNGVGGPADLAMVFSFMKGLDPNSVVRETEYESAAKSGNIFAGAFTKFNGYFKAKGGFLPDNVKKEFLNLVNQKLAVKEKQYNNVKSQYESIAKRQGLNPSNVVIDYASGAMTQQTINPPVMNLDDAYAEYMKEVGGGSSPVTPMAPVMPVSTVSTPSKTWQSMLPSMSGYKGYSIGTLFK